MRRDGRNGRLSAVGELGGSTVEEATRSALRPLAPASIVAIVASAAALQGVAFLASGPLGDALGRSKTLLDYCVHPVVANLAMLALLAWFVRRHGEPLTLATFGLRPLRWTSPDSKERSRVGIIAATGCLLLAVSPLATWTIDQLWSVVPGPSWALGNPDTYKGTFPIDVTVALVAFQLLVRIPLTVATEELLFRGWLQPRIGRWAPVTTGVLFALYHGTSQWWTVVELIPFGIALGVLRWWTGSLLPGATAHYAGNAIYLLSAV